MYLHTLPVKYSCDETTCYVLRGRWGETKTQTIVCIFSEDSRGELLQDSSFQIELFQNMLLYLIVMLGNHSFTITVSKSHQLYQLKKKKKETKHDSCSFQKKEHFQMP